MANEYYNTGNSIGQLIAAAISHHKGEAFKHKELGKLLGYNSQAPSAPTPGPISDMSFNSTVPISSPVMGRGGEMTAPTPPNTYQSAPEHMRPILGQTVGDISQLAKSLGPQTMNDVLQGLGVTKQLAGQADAMQLTMQPDGSFAITPGTKTVSARNANVILRQKDLANKRDLNAWRDAVEKRLQKGQLSKEEAIALRADSELLSLLVSPQFDLMDDTVKQQLNSQATAAINRLQQRGVTVYTGSRKTTTPAPTPQAQAASKPAASATSLYNQIKAANPGMSEDQILDEIIRQESQ